MYGHANRHQRPVKHREHDWKTVETNFANSVEEVRKQGGEEIRKVEAECHQKIDELDASVKRYTQDMTDHTEEVQAVEKKLLQVDHDLMLIKEFDKAKVEMDQLTVRAKLESLEDMRNLSDEMEKVVGQCAQLQKRDAERCEKMWRQAQAMLALDE